MPQYDDDDDDFDGDDFGQQQQRESNPVKHLRTENKSLKKELDELRAANATLAAQSRTSALRDALTDLKVNPKVAALYPSDKEATPEAVKAWVEDFGDVLGIQTQEESPPGQRGPQGQPSLDQSAFEAWQRMQSQESTVGQVPADIEQQQIAALQAMNAAAGSFDELVEFLRGEKKLPSA